jgi:hypothetical protein
VSTHPRHGESDRSKTQRPSPEYRAWCSMIARCCVPSNSAYPRYGGAGITICARWRSSYEAFLLDMGRKPSSAHSLDRVENSKGYEPANCRWSTPPQQARNKRTARVIGYQERSYCLTDLASLAGISVQLLHYRLRRGWPVERAVNEPSRLARSSCG